MQAMELKIRALVFAVLVFFSAVAASAQLPPGDVLALLEFKKGITHDPTGYIVNSWNEESIDFNGCPASWNGIVCAGDRVAGIVLDNLGLNGSINLGALAELSSLFKLSIANNSLSGHLPDDLSGFSSLKYLDISNNQFSGKLPSSVGTLTSLQNLTLAGNNFTGGLPASVGDLRLLESLDFSHNSFSGPIPPALKGLTGLVSLILSFNMFEKGIPRGLELMENLKSIDLSWNQLDGDVDWNFLVVSKVVDVDFSGNSLTSSGSNGLRVLSTVSDTIKYLNLSHNRLTGSLIDGGEISTFGTLKVLDLSFNQLSGDLPGFNYVYDLEILRLSNNHFSGFLPNGLLKGDSLVLNELDLSANNLTGPMSLITSTTLRVLNLSSNIISGELPLLTGNCQVLDLSKNQLTGNLSVIEKWGNDLGFVDISQNQLTGTFPIATSQFLRLTYLNISHNSLTGTLPELVTQYPKLSILDLSSNQFKGTVLEGMLLTSTLQELYLQNNILEGDIILSPSRKSSLLSLDLSGNHLNGSFPDFHGSLTGLQKLDISANNFSGSLPHSINSLTSLTSLDISCNIFTGPLPEGLPNTLVYFNASYNDLSGVVPANLRKFPDSSFHPGNSRLEYPGGATGPGNVPAAGSSHRSVKTSIKIAIITACAVTVFIIVLLSIILHYKKISRRSHAEDNGKNVQGILPVTVQGKGRDNGVPSVVSADDLVAAKKGSTSDILSPDEKMAAVSGFSPSKNTRFSWSPEAGDVYGQGLGRLDVRSPDRLAGDLYFLDETITLTPEELSRAPAEVLGRSSHGTSYRATLDNGVLLTVKWLREGVAKPKKEFAKEAKKFANIRHPNVVGLRGYYWGPTQHEKLILSDYISPGSLASFLYDRPGRRGPPLTWAQRLKIAVDVARGLNYLHFDRALPHGNLKATNILLDGLDLNARVADYCLHRLMTTSGTVEQILDLGALGYRAPELAATKKPIPSFKSDVYTFGVVLLELLTGRCAGDVVSGDEGGLDLTDWVRLRVAEGRGSDCFDPEMAPDISNPAASKGMKEMLGIALRCIRPFSERPGIKTVYEDLSSI